MCYFWFWQNSSGSAQVGMASTFSDGMQFGNKGQFIWASRTNTVRPFFKVSQDDKKLLLVFS